MSLKSAQDSTLPRVSIIIVTWNAVDLLKQCLPSVVETDYPNLEIIIADNDSKDDSVKWVTETYPSVKIVQHPENWAFCKGNNAAVPYATGKYILLLNNDVETPAGWLRPLVEVMESDDKIGALQPKLLRYDLRDSFEYAGASGGFLDKFGFPFNRGRLFFTLEKDLGQYGDVCDIFWATGAAMMLRKSVLDEVGLLDETFFMHMEEIDLCWRMQRAGFKIKAVPQSHVYHIGGASLPQGNPRKVFYNFRNGLLMLYKNLPAGKAWPIFMARLGFDSIAILRALLGGNLGESGAIIRGWWQFMKLKGQYKSGRPAETDLQVLPNYRGSIVADYFLRGKRNFQDLDKDKFQ